MSHWGPPTATRTAATPASTSAQENWDSTIPPRTDLVNTEPKPSPHLKNGKKIMIYDRGIFTI